MTGIVSFTAAKPPDKALHSFTAEAVASLEWGTGKNQVALSKAPANNFGPQRVVIDEAGIFLYLLDSANQRILAFNTTDKSFSSIPLPSNEADDFCVLDGKHFYLLFGGDKKVVLYNRAGEMIREYPIPNKIMPIGLQCHPKRGLIFAAFDGHFYRFNNDTPLQYVPRKHYAFHVERHDDSQGMIWLHNNDVNMTQELSIEARIGVLKTINFIGVDNDGNSYVSVEEIQDEGAASEKVVRSLRQYTATGELVAEAELPYSVYAYTFQDLAVTPSGEVFQMVPIKTGLEIVKWQRDTQPKMRGAKTPGPLFNKLFSYSEEQPEDFEPSEADDGITKGKEPRFRGYNRAVTRKEIIDNAKTYVNARFYVDRANITHGKYMGGKRVITPISSTGYYTGVPYKWGGNDSLSAFQSGLKKGKKAGDKCAKRCSGKYVGSSRAVGIDCSGLISQVWDLNSKYSTRNLSSVSTRLRSMNKLQAGDILIKKGHVILFSHKDSQGRFYVYEASSRDWKVSGRAYTLSKLKGKRYKPYRYQKVKAGYSGGSYDDRPGGHSYQKQPTRFYLYGSKAIAEGLSSAYTAKVFYDDGSHQNVTNRVSWSEKSWYADFKGAKLHTKSVSKDKNVYVKASYTESGKTLTAGMRVTIRNSAYSQPTIRLKIVGRSTIYGGDCTNYSVVDNWNNEVTPYAWSDNSRVTRFPYDGRLCSSYVWDYESVRIQASVYYQGRRFYPYKYIMVK